jgi:hypothetical protein
MPGQTQATQNVKSFMGALSLPMGEPETCRDCGDTLHNGICRKCAYANYESQKEFDRALMAEVRRGR